MKTDQLVKKQNRDFISGILHNLMMPVIAVIVGFIAGAIFMLTIGSDPVEAYIVLWHSTFGSFRDLASTLVNSTPLIFTGLAVAFAFRTGLFNIGGDGQFLVAYMVTAWVGFALSLPVYIHVPLAIVAGIIGGGIWGGFAGFLKANFGVHEVITTIMMNYISLYLVGYMIGGPLKKPGGIPATPKIKESARLLRIVPGSRLNLGFILAILAAVFIYYLLWKTTIGYEIRAVGFSPEAAEYGGISIARNMMLVMAISGALAGLAGTAQVMGLEHRAYQPFGFLGYGFTGIAVALLGKNHPAGVVLAAFLFGILSRGSMMMQSMAGVPQEVIEIIQAIIIIFVASEYAFTLLLKKFRKRKGDTVNAG
ncbi:MAG: ABC transporter permease [Bacillota bacterium]